MKKFFKRMSRYALYASAFATGFLSTLCLRYLGMSRLAAFVIGNAIIQTYNVSSYICYS